MPENLPFTGERFVPGVGGNIFLEHMHRYALSTRYVAGKDVLDIASGEGFGSSLLSQTARSVTGVDIAPEAVTHAEAKYGTDKLRFLTGSATAIPLPDASVDVVVSFETIEHISGHDEMMAEVKRVLRPGGVLVMSTPDKATYTDATGIVNSFHVRELYRDEFHALLSSQFAHVRMHGQKIGFGSLIVPEQGSAAFTEMQSETLQATDGLTTPMYLIGIASDDAAALGGMAGLFAQNMQASEPVLVRVDYEHKTLRAAFEADMEHAKAQLREGFDGELAQVKVQLREGFDAELEQAKVQLRDGFDAELEQAKVQLRKAFDTEVAQLRIQLRKAFDAELADNQETLQKRFDTELTDIRETIYNDLTWITAELTTLQNGNWMSAAPFFKLLSRMIRVRLLYSLSRKRWISARRRQKFLRSAEKRDPMLLASRLNRFYNDFMARISQSSFISDRARDSLARYGVRVTAVVPNYNHARFLRQRIDSILNQSYPLIDILILDDCSTDDSRAVIDEYVSRHPKTIRAIYNTENSGGVFRQWQKGYEQASGDLVWFCESDDFCDSDFVARLVPKFRNPAVNLAFGKIEFVDGEGHFMPGMERYLIDAEPDIWHAPLTRPAAAWFENGFGVKNLIANVGGSLWRRMPIDAATWEEARTYRVMGDWYLYSAVAKAGQIAYDPAAVAFFRIHGQNTSGAGAQATPDYYREYARLMTALKKRWPIPDRTVDRFVENCRSVYLGAGIQTPAFDTLLSADTLKSVPTEIPHVLIGMLGFSYGGGEIFPINLANALHRQGVMVSMLQMWDIEDHPDVRAMLDPGIPVYTANNIRDIGPKRFIDSTGISIVHSHIASVEMLMVDEADLDVPYLSTLHGSYEAMEIPRRKVAAWAERVDRYAYTTDRNLTAFKDMRLPQDKFCKMRNAMPVDPRPYSRSRAEMGIPDAAVVFAFVARGIEGKGWLEAIRAFRLLRARRPDIPIALLAVGEGPLTDAARTLAGTDADIHFLGYDTAIHGIYRLGDVALVPTRFPGESFPLCLIQAMQVGIPSVATDIGEIASMLHHDGYEAGLIVPYLQDDDAFLAALVDRMEAMLDSTTRNRLAADAARLGAGYSIDALATDYVAMYRDVIAQRQNAR